MPPVVKAPHALLAELGDAGSERVKLLKLVGFVSSAAKYASDRQMNERRALTLRISSMSTGSSAEAATSAILRSPSTRKLCVCVCTHENYAPWRRLLLALSR